MTLTKLAILGAAGRMGTALVRCASRVQGIHLTLTLENPGHESLGRDAGVIAGGEPIGIPISANSEHLADVDVLIDFTTHTAAIANVTAALQAGKGFVLGTTGLSPEESQAIRDAAEEIPIVWAPNMSLGVNLILELARKGAEVLGLEYDVEIVETHHRFKKDAPSGTALGLAESIATGRKQILADVACYGRQGHTGERRKGEIGIHALRSGDIIGDHTATFSTDGEQIILGHRATSRDAFAMGALKAARWVSFQDPGLYTMRDVLGIA